MAHTIFLMDSTVLVISVKQEKRTNIGKEETKLVIILRCYDCLHRKTK